jgi:hypothetical protein
MFNLYTVLTAAAIFIPLSIAAPAIVKNLQPITETIIQVDVSTLSNSEKKDYFLNLSFQTCLKETANVSPTANGQGRAISNACADAVLLLK